MPRRVLYTDPPFRDFALEREIYDPAGIEVVFPAAPTEAAIAEAAADVDAIAVCWAPVTAGVIAAAGERLKIVARTGVGLDNIDLAAAAAAGVPVSYVPDYCVAEMADHAFALLLGLSRNLGFYRDQARRGEFDQLAAPPMRRLSDDTLGIVGFGRTGAALASRAAACGMRVLAHTRRPGSVPAGVEAVPRDVLFAESDYVSLHCPLTPETRRIVGTETLPLMRPTACVINISRGELVDTDALEAALLAGEIGGAALDVFDPEPPDLSRPLFSHPRFLSTPHAAFLSERALRELRERAARSVRAAVLGEPIPDLVPASLAGQAAEPA